MNKMRSKLLLLVVIATFCLPIVSGEASQTQDEGEFTQQWSLDFGEVYVSTKPISTDVGIFVRTSSSSLAQGIPSVY